MLLLSVKYLSQSNEVLNNDKLVFEKFHVMNGMQVSKLLQKYIEKIKDDHTTRNAIDEQIT